MRPLLAAALLATCACASTRSSFPSRDEVSRLADTPAPQGAISWDVADVESWELEGPFPEPLVVAAHEPEDAWQRQLAAVAATRAGTMYPSRDMHCAAREVGRFWLANGARPTRSLEEFIAARCGTTASSLRVRTLSGEVSELTSEEELLASWGPQAAELFAEVTGNVLTGAWFGRTEGKAVLVVASGERKALVESVDLAAEGGLVMRGTLLFSAQSVEAMVNSGAYGVATCEFDRDVPLPRFVVRCPVAVGEAPLFELVGFPAGRVLGETALLGFAAATELPGTYRRPRQEGPTSSSDLSAALTELLNQVRQQAGLGPVRLERKQSETAARVAPHYFSAIHRGVDETVADQVVMGMMAGWDVEGMVRRGRFTSGLVAHTRDAGALLGSMLEHPWGRSALLSPEIGAVAFGPLVEASGAATIASTYTLMDTKAAENAAQRVLDALTAARTARGVEPPRVLGQLGGVALEVAMRLENGELAADDAMSELLQRSVDRMNHSMRGWRLESDDVANVKFPADLLEGPVALQICVAVARSPEDPWARNVVLIVYAPLGAPSRT